MKYALGMDIGGTRTKMGLVDLEKGMVVRKAVYSTEKEEAGFLEAALYHKNECVKGVKPEELLGIGAAASGYVHRGGRIDDGNSGFIPFFPSYPLEEKLGECLGMTCKVENDAAAGCLGEALYGAGKNYKRVLMLTLGTGVGVGFIRNGHIDDESSLIHLSGHIKVSGNPEEGGMRCYCGISGCLESVCSGTALEWKAAQAYGRPVSCKELFVQAEHNEEKAGKLAADYLNMLAAGLNQYIYIFAPDVIILGGGVAHALGGYTAVLQEQVTAKVHSRYKVLVTLSELKEEAGILGGASLVTVHSVHSSLRKSI